MSDQDPSIEQWRKAMQQSTGARLREALDANQDLALEYAKCAVEVLRLREGLSQAHAANLRLIQELSQAHAANLRLIQERDEARAEAVRLTEQLDRLPGYHLTEKAVTALDEADRQQP